MMAFLGMMVQELGITFLAQTLTVRRRVHECRLHADGVLQGSTTPHRSTYPTQAPFSSRTSSDGMGFPALKTCPGSAPPDRRLRLRGRDRRHAGDEYTGGPQNFPAATGSIGTILGGYPFTNQIGTCGRNRALTCELRRPRGHARHLRRHAPLGARLLPAPLLLPDHPQLRPGARRRFDAHDTEGRGGGRVRSGSLWTDARGISRFDLPVSRLAGCATLLASARASAARQGAINRAKSPPLAFILRPYLYTLRHTTHAT